MEEITKGETPKKKFSLKSIFFDEASETQQPVVNTQTQQPHQAPVQQQQVVVQQPSYAIQTPNGVLVPEIYEALKQVLEKRNFPGPDYLELKSSANAMKQFLPDENQRFQASYATLKATSPKLTKEIILESIDNYIKFIENERADSEVELKAIYDSEVSTRKVKIDQLSSQIEEAKVKITEYQNLIMKVSQDINTISGEMLSKQSELEIKKNNFDVTINTFVSDLKSDKIKIETLIN